MDATVEKKQNLVRSSLTFSLMTFVSRVLGLIRDMVTASFFGASPGYDAFVLAFRIPNLMRRLFAEGAFSQAFIPILSEYKVDKSPEEIQKFISKIAGNLSLALFIVTVCGILLAPWIIRLFAPGFDDAGVRQMYAADMLMITFPYIFFISLTALVGGILNNYGNFAIPAFTPVFLNICMIGASCLIAPKLERPEIALAWGVAFAGIVQLGFQLPFLLKLGIMPKLQIDWQDRGVRRVLLLMIPAIFGAAVGQINLLIDSWFASFLPAGSISWLYYSDRLMEFPLGILGVGLATVILPSLSIQHAKKSTQEFYKILDWGIRCILLIGIPAMLGLFILAGPLISTLFQSGSFSAHDVLMSQQSLQAYSFAIIGIMLAKIFSSAFYAVQNIKIPVRISVVILFINIILNTLLIQKMAHVGLALATAIASTFNAILLFIFWQKMYSFKFQPGWITFVGRLFCANIFLVIFLYFVTPDIQIWIEEVRIYRVLRLSAIVLGGAALYTGILLLTGIRPKQFMLKVV